MESYRNSIIESEEKNNLEKNRAELAYLVSRGYFYASLAITAVSTIGAYYTPDNSDPNIVSKANWTILTLGGLIGSVSYGLWTFYTKRKLNELNSDLEEQN